MTVIDGVFCLGRACDKQTRGAFQSSRLTGLSGYNTADAVMRDKMTSYMCNYSIINPAPTGTDIQ